MAFGFIDLFIYCFYCVCKDRASRNTWNRRQNMNMKCDTIQASGQADLSLTIPYMRACNVVVVVVGVVCYESNNIC